ncbi:MAG: GNAT family N-acetyltransferase [Parvularculaceae bacterium]
MSLRIRPATQDDAALVADLVRALARYEKLEHEMSSTPADFGKAFADPRGPGALIAEWEGAPCGLALYFFNFSTFRGVKGLYLEDLFVEEELRGRGIGKALLAALARVARAEGCARMEWAVLDWNAPSIAFYKSLGAVAMVEWTVYRLTGDPLTRLAERA